MDPRFRLEVGRFNSAMREMGAALGNSATMEQVIDFEVAKIVEMALKQTTAASVSSIRQSVEDREWTTLAGKKYKLSHRYPNAVWRSIVAKRKDSLTRKLAARGLSKQAWLALARQIGFDIEAPGYVKVASTPKHSNDQNVNTRRDYKTNGYGLTIQNKSPLIPWSEARQAFFGAVVGRRKFFDQNLKRGVFADLEKVARKYPGLIVRS